MHNFEYVSRNEYLPVKKLLEKLINLVQDQVKNYFTFSYRFVGSVDRNMVTRDIKSNLGYDFDIDLWVNNSQCISPKDIKLTLMKFFNCFNIQLKYDYCEDSTRVFTIKLKDKKNFRILHSCDFAIVRDFGNGQQQYIRFNKTKNEYYWEFQSKGFYDLNWKIDEIKNNNLWSHVRKLYLDKKNINVDLNKKSRSLFAESVNEVYEYFFKDNKVIR